MCCVSLSHGNIFASGVLGGDGVRSLVVLTGCRSRGRTFMVVDVTAFLVLNQPASRGTLFVRLERMCWVRCEMVITLDLRNQHDMVEMYGIEIAASP